MDEAGHPETTNHTGPARDALILRLLQEHEMGCPVCSQLLRGMTTPRCTECGAAINLQLIAPESRMRAWLIGIIALAIPFGFATMFAALLLLAGLVIGSHEPSTVVRCLIISALSGPPLAILLRRRRRFFGISPTAQHVCAAACVVLSLIFVAVLVQSAMRA